LKKKKNSIKKGKAQARIPGPAIFFKSSAPVCFIKKKKRIGKRRVACQPKIQHSLWLLENLDLQVFCTKKLIFSTISTTKHFYNTKKPIYQPNKPKKKGSNH
jgi:hypothetical protein